MNPKEVFDYRCRQNGIIYSDKDYLMAAMDVFLREQQQALDRAVRKKENRSYSVFDGERNNKHSEYKLNFVRSHYDNYDNFIAAFPDCCRVSRLPSDDDLDVVNENNNSYIRIMRRDGMLASFVSISHKATGVAQDGEVRTIKLRSNYEVGNCLEVRHDRSGITDWTKSKINRYMTSY